MTHARGGRGKGLRGREVGWERVRGGGRVEGVGDGKEERIWLVGRMELDEEDKDGEKRKGKRKEQREE